MGDQRSDEELEHYLVSHCKLAYIPRSSLRRLAHATVAITPDTYSHAIPALQEEAAALIAELVFADT